MTQCTAKSKRSQERCRKWALRGKRVCHMLGGRSTGPKSEVGKENSRKGVLKDGKYTKKAQDQNREVKGLIRQCKDTLRSIG